MKKIKAFFYRLFGIDKIVEQNESLIAQNEVLKDQIRFLNRLLSSMEAQPK